MKMSFIRQTSILILLISLLLLSMSCGDDDGGNNSPSAATAFVTSVPILYPEQTLLRNLNQTPDGGYLFQLTGGDPEGFTSVIKLSSDGSVDWRLDDIANSTQISYAYMYNTIAVADDSSFYYHCQPGDSTQDLFYGKMNSLGTIIWEYIEPNVDRAEVSPVFFADKMLASTYLSSEGPFRNTTITCRSLIDGTINWEFDPITEDLEYPNCQIRAFGIEYPSNKESDTFSVAFVHNETDSGCSNLPDRATVRYRDYRMDDRTMTNDVVENAHRSIISAGSQSSKGLVAFRRYSNGRYLAFSSNSGIQMIDSAGVYEWDLLDGSTYTASHWEMNIGDCITPNGHFLLYDMSNRVFHKYDALSQNNLWEYKLETYLNEDLLDPSYVGQFNPSFIATKDSGMLVAYIVPERDIVRIVKLDRDGGYPIEGGTPASANFEDLTITCNGGATHEVTLEYKTQACKAQQAIYTEIVLCDRAADLPNAKLDCLDICGRLDCYEGPTHYIEEE